MPEEEKQEELTLEQLKEKAKERGIKGYSKMNKEELQKTLEEDK